MVTTPQLSFKIKMKNVVEAMNRNGKYSYITTVSLQPHIAYTVIMSFP